ncbi:MAG: terminase [Anaerovoracaceae bacterium]
MAKDGTNRGGRRVRAGDKPMALSDKIAKGKSAIVMDLPINDIDGEDLKGESLIGEDMPNPSEYLSTKQRDGKTLGADEIYIETWNWLKDRGCEKLVNPRLIEGYAQAFARYIQCEEAISGYGLLGKHPTTGGAITSPFVQMSQSFQKQANLLWYEIFDIVKQNCAATFVSSPQEDMMERLLMGKTGK